MGPYTIHANRAASSVQANLEITALTYQLSQKEFYSVTHLSSTERFEHFVKMVANWEAIWVLVGPNGGILSGADDDGNYVVPMWPHPDYATACAAEEWQGGTPTEVNLQDFDDLLDQIAGSGRRLSIFPIAEGDTTIVSPQVLREALEEELEKY